jgi:hypothetical protein
MIGFIFQPVLPSANGAVYGVTELFPDSFGRSRVQFHWLTPPHSIPPVCVIPRIDQSMLPVDSSFNIQRLIAAIPTQWADAAVAACAG